MKKAFAKDGTKLRDKKYLEWIRGCTCVWGAVGGLPAGQCFGDIVPAHGKPWGRGIKGPDWNALPMCFGHHNQEHTGKLAIRDIARDKLVLALNTAYCNNNGITLEELRGKIF